MRLRSARNSREDRVRTVVLLFFERVACVSVPGDRGQEVIRWAKSGSRLANGPWWPSTKGVSFDLCRLLVKYSCESPTRCHREDCARNLLEELFTCVCLSPERCTDIVLLLIFFLLSFFPRSSLCSDPIGAGEANLNSWCQWLSRLTSDRKVFLSMEPTRCQHLEYHCATSSSSIGYLSAFGSNLF